MPCATLIIMIMTKIKSCALLQSLEAAGAGLQFRTFYDRQLASLELEEAWSAGHEAISWFSAAFQPRKWVQIRKVPVSVARSNTLPTIMSETFSFHLPPLSLKESVNSRCHHCRDTLLPTVAKTDVGTRAFDPRTTMEVLRQVQIIQFCILLRMFSM